MPKSDFPEYGTVPGPRRYLRVVRTGGRAGGLEKLTSEPNPEKRALNQHVYRYHNGARLRGTLAERHIQHGTLHVHNIFTSKRHDHPDWDSPEDMTFPE